MKQKYLNELTVVLILSIITGMVLVGSLVSLAVGSPFHITQFNVIGVIALLIIPVIYAVWPRDKDVAYYDYHRGRVIGQKGGKTKRIKNKQVKKNKFKRTNK